MFLKPSLTIFGTGYVGFAVAKHFRRNFHSVNGVIRTEANLSLLKDFKIKSFVLDIRQKHALDNLPKTDYALLSFAPPNRSNEAYRQTYLDGTRNVLEYLKKNSSLKKVIALSSTGVWKDRKGEKIDEETPLDTNSEFGQILIEAEQLMHRAKLPLIVFRLAGIYGPGRNRLAQIQKGTWPEPGPDRYMNMIHLDDIVKAVSLLFKKGKPGEVYIGVDDVPVKRSQFCTWLAGKGIQINKDVIDQNTVEGKQLQNKKLKSLGFSFIYPDFKKGYMSLLKP